MAKKYYDGRDAEKMGGDMISSDYSAIANMPQNVKYVQYPEAPYYSEPMINDSLSGIDRQMNNDVHSGALKKKDDKRY